MTTPAHQVSLHKIFGSPHSPHRVGAVRVRSDGIGKSLGDGRAAHHDLDRQPFFLDDLYGVFHAYHGGGHQGRQPDNTRFMLQGASNDGLRRHVLARVDNIKAVVFRINSPGGSAFASEQIWQALTTLKEKKPVDLKIATIFSYQANEDDSMDLETDIFNQANESINKHSREFLDDCIDDYNKEFLTNFSTDTFYNYYKDYIPQTLLLIVQLISYNNPNHHE